MFTAPPRNLQFPLDRAAALDALTPAGEEVCGLPQFPEDSDERITVLFRLSLNEFVALASAVDAGSDVAFGADAVKIWWLWVANVMCASFCEEMAQCLTDQNEALMAALADVLANNPQLIAAIGAAVTENGSGIPGEPLTANQASRDVLPENVKNEEGDCIYDALWGACLFLVQSGNRLITDFFERLESASNTLETSAIVAETVPAAGPYVSAAAQFADQLQENLSEGYAAAYTETYEENLACALFCLARDGCELTPDMLMDSLAERLGYIDGTENYGVLMARVGTGVFVGDGIADAMFYIYFAALRFGQQFLDQLGVRPMTDLMGLGADQLASDNWQTLCGCSYDWVYEIDLTTSADWGDAAIVHGDFVPGVGIVGALEGDGSNLMQLLFSVADWGTSTLTRAKAWGNSTAASSGAFRGFIYIDAGTPIFHDIGSDGSGDYILDDTSPPGTPEDTYIHLSNLNSSYGVNTLTKYRLEGTGTNPFL